ncbi:MAG TPA: CDP-alcohol phosphatidyltransferase family protein [Mycobacteriales bacterium]|nr:CDP-alcohol phosphatidyltransferase family protein [Mycobacteriales bacterium]
MPPSTGEPAAGEPVGRVEPAPDRALTIPNVLSVLRLLGVPVFLWLLLGPHADGWALVVLAVSGATDYLDGKIARALHQTSRIGILLDPAADRLYIFATLLAFVLRDVVPLWLAAAVVGRDALLALTLPVLKRHGYGPLPVHYLGKAATFNLLYAFPLLLLAHGHSGPVAGLARPIGYAFTGWGVALYAWSGALYLVQVTRLVRAEDPSGAVDGVATG